MSGVPAPAETAAMGRLAESVYALVDLAEPGSKLERALCEFSDALSGVLCPVAGSRKSPEINQGEPARDDAPQLQEAGHG